MKKNYLITVLLSAWVLISSISCTSIPKKVKENSNLAIGCITVECKGSGYSNLDGKHKSSIEITVKEVLSKKVHKVFTDSDGFFVFPKLTPNDSCVISNIHILVPNGGGGVWVDYNPDYFFTYFTVKPNQIQNLGHYHFIFDYNKNIVELKNSGTAPVKYIFEEKCPEESEWRNVSIVNSTINKF